MTYEFSTDIDFIDIPITLSYKGGHKDEQGNIEKILRGNTGEEEITFIKMLNKLLAVFGATELDLGFEGLGFKNIEVAFDLAAHTVAFKSTVGLKELEWLRFNFNFREIKTPENKGFIFEFIPDATADNNKLSFPGGLPVIKDELKENLYIVFEKVIIATTSDPENKDIKEGFYFKGKSKIFGSEEPIDLYLFEPSRNAQARHITSRNTSAPEAKAIANDSTKWFDINKSLGPFTLRKIGFQYDDLV